MPQYFQTDSLEEDAPDDHEKVANGVGIGDDLNGHGHIGDGEDKTRQQNHG